MSSVLVTDADLPADWPAAPFDLSPPLTTTELEAFTGEATAEKHSFAAKGYYLPKWRRILEGRSQWAGFNWAAFFMGWLWCLYRRMYRIAVLILVVPALLSLAVVGLLRMGGSAGLLTNPEVVNFLMTILSMVFLGAFGNILYLEQAVRAIRNARAGNPGDAAAALARRDGVSRLALVAGLALPLVAGIIAAMLSL